ncbi:hypothetical protein GGR57DRAFT_502764 [Xylariaceae sp. FL1272]|nr:hypothetical protein GGR57DRAFT_502764 [Xylariaceae sp. FL1272]
MKSTHSHLIREQNEMTESPIIPRSLSQQFLQTEQQGQSYTTVTRQQMAGSATVMNTGSTPTYAFPVPPLSARPSQESIGFFPACVMGNITQTGVPMGMRNKIPEPPSVPMTYSPATTIATTMATTTPISPSPSLFPLPPAPPGIVASPATISPVSPFSHHRRDSEHTIITATPAPRPVSSVYSQSTFAGANSSPRTPTLPSWDATLPGLKAPSSSYINHARSSTTIGIPLQQQTTNQEFFIEPLRINQPASQPTQPQPQETNQNIEVRIQVPRLRSPSLPGRRRTLSNAAHGDLSLFPSPREYNPIPLNNLPLTQPSPPLIHQPPKPVFAPMSYEGGDWPLPSQPFNTGPASRGSNASSSTLIPRTLERPYYNTNSNPNTPTPTKVGFITSTNGHKSSLATEGTEEPSSPTSPRTSLADSRTPIYGPGERSRFGEDFEHERTVEEGRYAGARGDYGNVEIKRPVTGGGRKRLRWIIILAVVVFLLVVVGVAVGVVFGMKGKWCDPYHVGRCSLPPGAYPDHIRGGHRIPLLNAYENYTINWRTNDPDVPTLVEWQGVGWVKNFTGTGFIFNASEILNSLPNATSRHEAWLAASRPTFFLFGKPPDPKARVTIKYGSDWFRVGNIDNIGEYMHAQREIEYNVWKKGVGLGVGLGVPALLVVTALVTWKLCKKSMKRAEKTEMEASAQ